MIKLAPYFNKRKQVDNITTICFSNNKGGSGKSTACSNVAYGLASMGHKVLAIDGDMQMNLTLSFFGEDQVLTMAESEKNLYYAMKHQKDLKACIYTTSFENLDVIPSSMLMSSIEYELFTKWQREFVLQKCLRTIKEEGLYDYILIDSPPTLGGWVINILCASDYMIIPVEATPWGLFGIANMFDFLNDIKEMAPNLSVMGILLTKVDERKNYLKQTLEAMKEMGDIKVFNTKIHVDSSIEWAQDNSMPVMAFKKSAKSAKEYELLSKEVANYASR